MTCDQLGVTSKRAHDRLGDEFGSEINLVFLVDNPRGEVDFDREAKETPTPLVNKCTPFDTYGYSPDRTKLVIGNSQAAVRARNGPFPREAWQDAMKLLERQP